MAESAKPWNTVFDQINVHRAPDWVPIPPPTDSELDAVEAQVGAPLPRSYRAFLKRFGPGDLECAFRFTPISLPNPLNQTVADDTLFLREYFVATYPRNGIWLGRVVYFACNAGGEYFVWDPKELAESKNQECPVYILRRHEEDQPERVAASFFETVLAVLVRVRAQREGDPAEEGYPADAFEPYYLRMKEPPSQPDVALWLAFNNNTARDLALAIRDRGQTDAFPILADVLQEAGCTNADLLDSCRTGDPDIDGKWVLQVLLGKS